MNIRAAVCLGLLACACGARTELDPLGPDGMGDAAVLTDAGPDSATPDGAIPGPGVTVALYSGNITFDGTTWGRPYSCGDAESRDRHAYSVQTFANTTSADLVVEILVDWDFDGFLHVFQSPFDASRLDVGCLGANDDNGSTRSSRVTNIRVPSGGAIDLVLSSWSAGSTGNYDAFVITQ